jgi:predicted unusual protein kinase regulating ubiquinone biosynthesis (AarF/ABC1/UbiB family)
VSGTINRMFKLIGRDIELQSIIEEFGKLIYEEIDYISEARNAERFLELYGGLPNVNVPRVFWRYTKRRVLTMQWMEGSRLTSAELSGKNSELVRAMVQCSLRQMLENGYFHADTHLGNLLADEGSLTYLDFGMMSMVEPQQRYGIIEAVVHMVNRDFEALTKLYVRLGFLPADIDRTPISNALSEALPDVLGASVGELNFKSVIDKLGSVMYRYPFRLPPYYTAVIRCLGVLEGVAIQVDPNFKILNESYPYIASRLLTDPAPELQEALQALLFDPEGRPRWSRLESLLENAAETDDYDVSLAVEQLVSFLLSPKGKAIRYTLADDLTNELDLLGADLSRYYLGLAVQAGSTVGIRVPGMFASMSAPKRTAAMENLDKLSKILSRSRGFNPNQLAPVIRRVLREPEGQRIGLEVAVSLAERFTSRAIRFAFGLPAPEPPTTTVRTSQVDPTG